jgi:23S rRNA pseudouridine2605 synthase
VRYGDVFIPSRVKQGQWVELDHKEVKSLYRLADLPVKDLQRGTAKEREVMERQFGKRSSRGAPKSTRPRRPRS